MPEFDFDAVVVGGGVVGLAALYKLSLAGWESALLERHDAVGRETSGRNSEVVHGGMYYPPGSLKARLCTDGRRQLYRFVADHGVPHKRLGKIIVATVDEECAALEDILATGKENGVEDLHDASAEEMAHFADGVRAVAALVSPNTGVVNAHAYMDALAREAVRLGGLVVCGAEVTALTAEPGGWMLRYCDRSGDNTVRARAVVNAAGLRTGRVMAMAGLDPGREGLRTFPCRGRYFSVGGESRKRIHGLVYPAPEANLAGLGIHTVVDVAGGVKLGPDVEYIEEAEEYDYRVDESLGDLFYARASRYLPFLRREDIQPDMAGVRPKLSGPGEAAGDFYIAHETARGLHGFINLAGIESPGLTASLAIGDRVEKLAREWVRG